MTKFEEELNKYNIFERTVYLEGGPKEILIAHFKNWHSDEEFQELKEEYSNQAESILLMLDEIKSLKSQLQQRALPVVPEDVAKLPPFDDMKEYVLDERLLTIREYLNKLDDKSNSDITEAEAWCMIHEDIAYRAMLDGYQVEKPKMYYLKHIDMSRVDETHDWFILRHGNLGHSPFCKGELPYYCNNAKHTQKEIDSMKTGSYEQIEVAE